MPSPSDWTGENRKKRQNGNNKTTLIQYSLLRSMYVVGLQEEAADSRERSQRMLVIKPATCEASVLTTVSTQYKTGKGEKK